jgi:hypothetical protein
VRINVPAEGTENDDKNPARSAPRNLFHGDGYRWSTSLDRDQSDQKGGAV